MEKRYTALECSLVRGAAAVKPAVRANERSDKMLRFTEEEERSALHIQAHKLNCNLTELKSVSDLMSS